MYYTSQSSKGLKIDLEFGLGLENEFEIDLELGLRLGIS